MYLSSSLKLGKFQCYEFAWFDSNVDTLGSPPLTNEQFSPEPIYEFVCSSCYLWLEPRAYGWGGEHDRGWNKGLAHQPRDDPAQSLLKV